MNIISPSILLTCGQRAIVDESDYIAVSAYEWYYTAQGYASTGKYPNNILMHRLIMQCPKGLVVDHIDGNKLDNRKCNLQIITHGQNLSRAPKSFTRPSRSKYKGITLDTRTNKWQVRCTDSNGVSWAGGSFKSELDAAIAYNELALKHQTHNTFLNKVDLPCA